MRLFSIVLLGLGLYVSVQAQESRQYVFTHLSKSNGLLSDRVHYIHQDKRGYIWLATANGLFRYDGHTISHTEPAPNGDPFPNLSIIQIVEDKQQNLWLQFAENQVGIYNPFTRLFHIVKIQVDDRAMLGGLAQLNIDNQGRVLYLLQGKQLLTYDPVAQELSSKYNFIHLPEGWRGMSLSFDSTNHCYWICTAKGVVKYNDITKQLSYRGHNTDNEWVIDDDDRQQQALTLFTDRKNRQWVVSWPKGYEYVACHDPKNKTRKYYDPQFNAAIKEYYQVNGFIEQANGEIWSYGMPFLGSYDEKEGQFKFVPRKFISRHGIEFDEVFHMYSDREQNIWVGTNNGVYIFNPKAQVFENIKTAEALLDEKHELPVTSILQTQNKDIWVSTWYKTVFRYDSHYRPLKNFEVDNNEAVWNMCQRKNGDIWLVGQPGWIAIHHPFSNKTEKFYPSLAGHRTIRQSVVDRNDNVWLGLQNGKILKWDASKAARNVEAGLSEIADLKHIIHRLYVDSSNNLWICTLETGLYKFNTETGQLLAHYTYGPDSDKHLSHLSPADIIQYDDSLMIVIGNTVDILNVNTNKVKHLAVKDGLNSAMLHNLVKDKNGFVWIGTGEGLLRYNVKQNIFSTPSHEEGFIDEYIEMGAATILHDGRITMGTSHDVLVFDPSKTFTDLEVPPVRITEFLAGNKSLPLDSLLGKDRITLDYGRTTFSISYSAMSQLQKNQLTYYYKLEGIDKDWIQGGTVQRVQYNFLPAGNFSFKVKVVNGYGKSSPVTTIKVYVRPPFWKTPWFFSIVVLAGLTIAYLLNMSRMKRRTREQEMRNRIAVNLHNEICDALSSVNVLGEMVRMKMNNDTTLAKDYIFKITESNSQTIEAMDDILWSLNPDNDTMTKVIEHMKKVAKLQLSPKSISFSFSVTDKVLRSEMDMQTRHDLLILYKTIIKNIAACSNSYHVKIDLAKAGANLQLSIEDDGNYLLEQDLNQMPGIEEIRKRVSLLNASLVFNAAYKVARATITLGVCETHCKETTCID